MEKVPLYKSIRFYLLFFSFLLALLFFGQIYWAFFHEKELKPILSFSLVGLILVWINVFFVSSRLDKELTLLRQSIKMVIENKFSRKFKLHTLPIEDEIGLISNEVSIMLDKVHQRTTEVLQKRKEIEEAYNTMEKLGAIGREITSHLDVVAIIKDTFSHVEKLLETSLLAVGIYDKIKQGLLFYGIRPNLSIVSVAFDDMTDPNHWGVYCFNSQKETICNSYGECSDKYFSTLLFSEPIEKRESFIYIPLSNGNQRIGVFTVQAFKKNAYTNYHLGILRNLAHYMTVALVNADAFKQIDIQKKEIEFSSEELKKAHDFLEIQVNERTKELQKQKEEIELKSHELERLSMVARKTDNAIMIMDAYGNIQWVNDCFTRIYKYTYEEFIKKRGTNIIQTSFNPNIKSTLEKCITSKKSVYYEALNVTFDGKEVWTQTTLTPVLNNEGEITHLLTIDSDVTLRKEYEIRITKQSQDITNSIIYAKRIQKAILPPIDWFSNNFKDYFLIYKPKDIVSGDFYWMGNKSNKLVFALADCTGHGVPGAFMSMLGISLLNEIVKSDEWKNASEILNILREKIKISLRQNHNNYEMSDGMDISLCCINKEDGIIDYAGANSNIYILSNNNLMEIKGDKMPIGLYINDEIPFTSHTFPLSPDNRYYLSTDGFYDQFGGERDSKFSIRRFKDLIIEKSNLSFSDQRYAFESALNKWQGKNTQIDDICIVGFSI